MGPRFAMVLRTCILMLPNCSRGFALGILWLRRPMHARHGEAQPCHSTTRLRHKQTQYASSALKPLVLTKKEPRLSSKLFLNSGATFLMLPCLSMVMYPAFVAWLCLAVAWHGFAEPCSGSLGMLEYGEANLKTTPYSPGHARQLG